MQLAGGPKHRKADSMPESFYETEEMLPGSKDVTVVRSHSDSRKRTSQNTLSVAEIKEGASAEEIEKLRVSLVLMKCQISYYIIIILLNLKHLQLNI